jgi:hypothetical protein
LLIFVPPVEAHPVEGALRRSADLVHRADAEGTPILAAQVIEPEGEPIVVLGALQNAARLLEAPSEVRTVRRRTTGTALTIDGGLLLTLALPSIETLFRDASPRTILNRNVRPFLHGLAHAGIPCVYWGREWLAHQRRPIAVIGLDATRTGGISIELWLTMNGSLAIDRSRATDLEAGTERYRGAEPISLATATARASRSPHELAERFLEGAVRRLGIPTEAASWSELAMLSPEHGPGLMPSPEDHPTFVEPLSVPIGWLDIATTDRGIWIGGDVLAPTFTLGHAAHPSLGESLGAPIEGASWDDVRRAFENARNV